MTRAEFLKSFVTPTTPGQAHNFGMQSGYAGHGIARSGLGTSASNSR